MSAIEIIAPHASVTEALAKLTSDDKWFDHLPACTLTSILLRFAMLEANPALAAKHDKTACLSRYDAANTSIEGSLIAEDVCRARLSATKADVATPAVLDWLDARVRDIYALAGRACGADEDKLGDLFDDFYIQLTDVGGLDAEAYMLDLAAGDEPWAVAVRKCVDEYRTDRAEQVSGGKRSADDDDEAPPAKCSRGLDE